VISAVFIKVRYASVAVVRARPPMKIVKSTEPDSSIQTAVYPNQSVAISLPAIFRRTVAKCIVPHSTGVIEQRLICCES